MFGRMLLRRSARAAFAVAGAVPRRTAPRFAAARFAVAAPEAGDLRSKAAAWPRGFASTAAAADKTTTGLVGLDVEPQWKEKLLALYAQTLEDAKALPEDSKYRQNVEAISTFRAKVVEEEDTGDGVEARVDCGQVEEMIVHAQDELSLLQHYVEMRLWEPAPEE